MICVHYQPTILRRTTLIESYDKTFPSGVDADKISGMTLKVTVVNSTGAPLDIVRSSFSNSGSRCLALALQADNTSDASSAS